MADDEEQNLRKRISDSVKLRNKADRKFIDALMDWRDFKRSKPQEPIVIKEDVACAGNIVAGTPCSCEKVTEWAPKTLHDGKLFDTCKDCKKAIKKTRKEHNKK